LILLKAVQLEGKCVHTHTAQGSSTSGDNTGAGRREEEEGVI